MFAVSLPDTHHQLLSENRHVSGVGKWGTGAMIDWKRVEELRSEIGADGFAEVAEMFLEEADQAVSALLAGLPVDEIEAQLHFLKGSALNLGFAELASLCQDGERKAAAGYGQLVDMAKVAALYQGSRALLVSGLADGTLSAGTAA